jgi:SmpA / OmlA family
MIQKSGSYLKRKPLERRMEMEKKELRGLAVWMGLLVFISALMLGVGCSREQAPPPPPQSAAPAPAAPAAPAPAAPVGVQQGAAPATQPGAPGAPAPSISQVQTGMTMEQVKQIMGNPAEIKQKGAITEYKYYTPQKVEVKFQNNQVMAVEMH